MSELVHGAALPLGPSRSNVEVVGLRAGEEGRFLLLGDSLLGLECHWIDKVEGVKAHSVLCTYLDGQCPYHAKERGLWLGYIAALEMVLKQRVVLRVGEQTARRLLQVLGAVTSLRGAHVLLGLKRTQGGTVAAVEMLHHIRPDQVPPAFPIEPALRKVYGVERLPDYGRSARELAAWSASDENGGVS